MQEGPLFTRRTTLLGLLALAVPATPAPAQAGEEPQGTCDPAVTRWAQAASTASGKQIRAVACPSGLIRLEVVGAGCDYEVSKGRGFRRSADGAFGVSPIVNLDWDQAPEAMKQGLEAVLASLARDPSLRIPTGEVLLSKDREALARRQRMVRGVGAASGAAVLGGVGWALWKRRKPKAPVTAPSETPAPAPEAPPEPPAAA